MTIPRHWFFIIMLACVSLGLTSAAQAQTLPAPRDGALPLMLFPQAEAAPPTIEDLLWLAQSCEGDCGNYETTDNGRNNTRFGTNLNKGTTRKIVKLLQEANDTCDTRIERRYRIDCLRVYYGWIADDLPDSGDYLPIKQQIQKAEKKLAAIVSANVDTKAPVITPRKGHKPSAKKLPPLRAVKKSAESKAVGQATAVINGAQLLILRSGEDPTRRTAHYEEVSAALDSNLVILRSA